MFFEDIPVKVKIIDKEFIAEFGLPEYKTPGSAGMDLRACIESSIVIEPDQAVLIPTGFAAYVEDRDLMFMLSPRSGLGHKHGIVLGNLTGIIDSDYQGQLMVSCWNRSGVPFEVKRGERIAQAILLPTMHCQWAVVEDFEPTKRAEGGFNSTGTN